MKISDYYEKKERYKGYVIIVHPENVVGIYDGDSRGFEIYGCSVDDVKRKIDRHIAFVENLGFDESNNTNELIQIMIE